MKQIILAFIMLYFSSMSNAADCFDLSGRDYHIDPDLLRAIAWNESRFVPTVIGKNKGYSVDIGIMQINSQHFSNLSRIGVTQDDLLNDACMNIYTGAYILAQAFHKWGVNWQSVGAYNAGFSKSEKQALRRYHYAIRVESIYRAIKDNKKRTR